MARRYLSRRVKWLLAAFAAAVLATPTVGAVALSVSPDPPRADAPFTVTATGFAAPADVANASLRACLAENGEIVFCLIPTLMARSGDAWVATTPLGFDPGSEVGLGITYRYRNGTIEDWPLKADNFDARGYFFVTVADADRRFVPSPMAWTAVLAVVVAAGAAAVAARLPRGRP